MRAVYDQVSQTVYIYVNGGITASSDELVPDLVFADYDRSGGIIGIEVVGIDEFSDMSKLKDLTEGINETT